MYYKTFFKLISEKFQTRAEHYAIARWFNSGEYRSAMISKAAGTMPIPPELWSEFEVELDRAIAVTHSAEKGYVDRRGMSLACMAVVSAGISLSKVIYCLVQYMMRPTARYWGCQSHRNQFIVEEVVVVGAIAAAAVPSSFMRQCNRLTLRL